MNKQFVEALKKSQNKWVAFDKSRTSILASGKSIGEVQRELTKKKIKAHVLEFILPFDVHYAPLCQKNAKS